MAAFTGTAGADTIVGSNSPDTIDGLGGADLIFGYGDGSGVGGTVPTINSAGGGPLAPVLSLSVAGVWHG